MQAQAICDQFLHPIPTLPEPPPLPPIFNWDALQYDQLHDAEDGLDGEYHGLDEESGSSDDDTGHIEVCDGNFDFVSFQFTLFI